MATLQVQVLQLRSRLSARGDTVDVEDLTSPGGVGASAATTVSGASVGEVPAGVLGAGAVIGGGAGAGAGAGFGAGAGGDAGTGGGSRGEDDSGGDSEGEGSRGIGTAPHAGKVAARHGHSVVT